MQWRGVENEVLSKVFQAGALTTRRVTREHGPKPNWSRLLERGYLREVHTVYGPVLAATPLTRQLSAQQGVLLDAPYLAGPSAIADRAYQMDALALLAVEGYTLHRHEYRRSTGVGLGAGRTSQILLTVLRVPPRIEAQLSQDWGFVYAPKPDAWDIHPEVLGYPNLYASISGRGIRLPRLRTLYRRHRFDIHVWRHPLLVAVPEEDSMRAFVRALEAERDELERTVPSPHPPPRFPYPLVRFILLPVP
ncbi:hypothetical protein DAETH_47930 (plasmid) [Deinococcus aetherius]|uniref:Uncharacterized protein n=1 Tax=Deinococcus aetherius TaxID=200252 RepID=A0ABM8ALT9_9DEIO|nr:hypothetical protein [Deinococcus aetherius]BDP44824.1 hypothetical protein DAETH_47930 [Deinococcus aetherius]